MVALALRARIRWLYDPLDRPGALTVLSGDGFTARRIKCNWPERWPGCLIVEQPVLDDRFLAPGRTYRIVQGDTQIGWLDIE